MKKNKLTSILLLLCVAGRPRDRTGGDDGRRRAGVGADGGRGIRGRRGLPPGRHRQIPEVGAAVVPRVLRGPRGGGGGVNVEIRSTLASTAQLESTGLFAT